MQSTRIRRILIIVSVISLFMSYIGIWIRFINDPSERTGSDFIAFYSAGRVAQLHGKTHVYDSQLQQQIQQEQVGFSLLSSQVLLYNHLPFLIPLLERIVSTNYVASFYRWIVLLIALYIAGTAILSRALKRAEIDQNSILLTAAGALLFLPVFFSLMNGQDTAFLFLGAAVWMFGLISGREFLAGLGLSLTTVRPHLALFIAIPMFFYSRKVFWGFLLGAGILGLLSVPIIGLQGTKEFIEILLLSAGGEWYGMKENAMFNLIGLLTRTVPHLEAGTIRTLGWIVYAASIVALCRLWFKTKDLRNGVIGLSVTLALFVAPHLHFHDLALLLIPIYEVIRTSRESGNLRLSTAVLLPFAISILFLISNISPYLQYTTPYFVMLLLASYPYYLKYRQPITTLHQS